MRPGPTTSSVRPASSAPSQPRGSHVRHSPACTARRRLGQPPRDREDQREGEVGRRVRQHVRRAPDRDAALRARLEVDVVRPDRVVGDDPQPRAGVEQRGVDAVGQQAQQALGAGRPLAQRLRAPAAARPSQTSTSSSSAERVQRARDRRVTKTVAIAVALWFTRHAQAPARPRRRPRRRRADRRRRDQERHHSRPRRRRARRSTSARGPTFKGKVSGEGTVWIHVSKSKKTDGDGVIGNEHVIQQAKRKNGKFSVKAKFFDFPDVLAQLAGHVLLAGAPHQLRGQTRATASRRARSSSFKVG